MAGGWLYPFNKPVEDTDTEKRLYLQHMYPAFKGLSEKDKRYLTILYRDKNLGNGMVDTAYGPMKLNNLMNFLASQTGKRYMEQNYGWDKLLEKRNSDFMPNYNTNPTYRWLSG